MPKKTDKTEFYLGNPNLPAADAVIAYEPWMVKDIKKCRQNLLYFAENFFYIINPEKGKKQVIKMFPYQKQILRTLRDNNKVILLASRQCGKTTLLTIYALWVASFNDYQNIVIVANKESTAIEVFRRIKLAYEELPLWIKPGVISFATTSCEFDNGSRISISTTTGSAARGMTITTLLLDELAFIEPASILEDFWRSVYPTISRSPTAKVLIASTPNGTGNLFYKLFNGAEKKENGFVYERVRWYDIPGRDEAWKLNEIRTMGSVESFLQEYETVFLASGESSINEELFAEMSQKCKDPKIILEEGNYKIWEDPDSTRVYVAGVDISEGVGIDASVIQILDITDLKDIRQVAVYHNRNIPPLEFANKVYTKYPIKVYINF